MRQLRRNEDFTRGPVWAPETQRYQVEIRYPDGSRKRRRYQREREAQRWWASETAKIENGTWNETAPKNITLGKAFDDYREYSKTHHRSYRTYVEPVLRFWEGELSRDTLLAKISTAQIEAVKLAQAADREPATVDKSLSVLKAFFNWCIRQGAFNGNPVRKVRFFHPNNEVLRYLTMEEYQRLLESSDGGPWYLRPLIELSANTGLRRGNLLSLRWEEIDLEARVIRKTRTKNSRTLGLPLNERVVEILKGLLEGREGGAAFVFLHREGQQAGQPILDVKNSIRAALRRAGIRNFRWYDLRHCFGSWLVMGGANLVAVQKLMGHCSIRMTLRYAHLSPQYLKGEVEILDKTLPKSCPFDTTNSGKEQQQEAKKEDDTS